MVALKLETMITEVSCIAPVEKVVIDKCTSLIAPSIFRVIPLKYLLSKTLQTDPDKVSVSQDGLTYK